MPVSKLESAEERVGMTLPEYLRMAAQKGYRQKRMQQDLGVSRSTVSVWLRSYGYMSGFRKRVA